MADTADQERVWKAPNSRELGPNSMPFAQIISIMRQRRTQDSRLIRGMIQVRDRYNGDVVIPLADVKNSPAMAPPTPNLIIEAVDGLAMRANAMTGRITTPPKDSSSESSREIADRRRRGLYGHWHLSQMEIKLFRAYRHLIGYGTFAMVTLFDDQRQRAVTELRDPLTAYPELRAQDDIREPMNCGFLFARSVDWIRTHYPTQSAQFIQNAAGRSWDTLWDMVEWIDENEIVIGIMGPKLPAYGAIDARPYGYTAYELARWPNKAGCVPVVAPRRVTLDRIQGQMTSLLGFNDSFGRATALDFVAMERAIFPDLVIIGANGAPPQLFAGEWYDGREGKPNLIGNATVQVLDRGPGPMSAGVLENMERAIRSTGGAQGPDSFGNARSGSQVNAMAGLTSDPRLQELNTIMGRALTEINEHIQKTQLGYAPNQKYFIIPGLRADMQSVEILPSRDFVYTENVVDYPYAGLDIAQLSVSAVQLQGAGLMSKKTARAVHPLIDDGTQEEELTNEEALDSSLLAAYAAAIQNGTKDPLELALVRHHMEQGEPMYLAAIHAAAEIAKNAPPPTQQDPNALQEPPQPGQPNPALSGPSQDAMAALGDGGAQGPPPQVPAVGAGLTNGRHLLQAVNENLSSAAV